MSTVFEKMKAAMAANPRVPISNRDLDKTGTISAKVKLIKKSDGTIVSPRIQSYETGAVKLHLCFEVLDDIANIKGATIWDDISLSPKNYSDQATFAEKSAQIIDMLLRKIIPLSGDTSLTPNDIDGKILAIIGHNAPEHHKLMQPVAITVDRNADGRLYVKRLQPLPDNFTPHIYGRQV